MGIEKVKPGNTIGDISKAIQKYVEAQGFNVVQRALRSWHWQGNSRGPENFGLRKKRHPVLKLKKEWFYVLSRWSQLAIGN